MYIKLEIKCTLKFQRIYLRLRAYLVLSTPFELILKTSQFVAEEHELDPVLRLRRRRRCLGLCQIQKLTLKDAQNPNLL